MARPSLEVADILNRHGVSYLARHRLSRAQLKVMSAVRACRTAALGGHVMACGDCDHATIAYNLPQAALPALRGCSRARPHGPTSETLHNSLLSVAEKRALYFAALDG